MKKVRFVGLDVHAETIAVAIRDRRDLGDSAQCLQCLNDFLHRLRCQLHCLPDWVTAAQGA